MVLGILFLILSILFGFALTRLLPLRLYRQENWAWAPVLGLGAATWLTFLLALALPYAYALPLSGGLMTVLIMVLPRFRSKQAHVFPAWGPSEKGRFVWLAYSILSFLGFAYLFWTHMLPTVDGSWKSVGATWGDVAVHATFIAHFAQQSVLSLELPVYAGAPHTYPFLVDYLSSVFYRLGWNHQASLAVPGFVLAVATAQILFFTGLRVVRRSIASVAAACLLFFSGSAAALLVAWERLRDGVDIPLNEFSFLPDQGLHTYNFILGFLLPQRGFLLGLPIFLIITSLLWYQGKREDYRPSLWAALLLGSLPLVHPHSMMVAGVLWFSLLAVGRLSWKGTAFLLLAGALALPQLLWQMSGAGGHGSFTAVEIGWLSDGENLAVFWLRNWGLLIPLFLGTSLWLAWRKRTELAAIQITAVALFVVANVLRLQPNMYDNSKLLVYAYFLMAWTVAYGLFVWAGPVRLRQTAAILLVTVMSLPGIVSLLRSPQNSYQFMAEQDIAFGREVAELLPENALVLSADNHNHPVPTVAGKQLVMGYRGWLWTYDIDYSARERDVAAMFGPSAQGRDLLESYGVEYVVVGPPERERYGAATAQNFAAYEKVYDDQRWQVYKVR